MLDLQSIGITSTSVNLLLKGNSDYERDVNIEIFRSVHKYIELTNRL